MENQAALGVTWAFGFNKDIIGGVQSLTTDDRNALFALSSHSGIIYDFEHRRQTVLQGHCNQISCCAVSNDKRWIVTGDLGEDSILVVWDSRTGVPVKTLFNPHNGGVTAIDISNDSLFVVTIGENNGKQDIAVWAWTNDGDSAILRQDIHGSDHQHAVRFDPEDQSSIVSTGQSTVFFWTWLEYACEGYCARVTKSEFGYFSGSFTATVFLSSTGTAITSTTDGYVIFWESQSSTLNAGGSKRGAGPIRTASKVLRLVECGINTMITTKNNYLAIGCSDGAIRFYDFFLRLEAWFEDLCAGPITSVSLGIQQNPFGEGDAGAPGLRFWVPDFLAATSDSFIVGIESSIFDEVRIEDRRGTLLLQGLSDEVLSVACHPSRTLVAFACNNGTLHVWDYELKLLMNLREFNDSSGSRSKSNPDQKVILKPQSVAFSPLGDLVVVGFSTGAVKFLNCNTFEDISTFSPSTVGIHSLRFSNSGSYLCGHDSDNHILLFKRNVETAADSVYSYIGRIKSHIGKVTGLEFGFRESSEVLMSIGEDRRCVEYDLEVSSVSAGLVCLQAEDGSPGRLIDQAAIPTALIWHPHTLGDVEDRFIFATSEFKFKELNVDSKQCRKTTLAPTFGGPPTKLVLIPTGGLSSITHFAYATHAKVIGIGSLPLTGNPNKVMGLVAHPGRVSDITVSFDGKYLFSAGGADLSVNMWAIDTLCIPGPDPISQDIDAFYSLLDGGAGGDVHNDIIDYFYYGQIRAQGEDSMDTRNVSGKIPLEEVPSLMRAIGFYPSEQEIHNMINEVRYKTFMNTGETINEIGLNDFVMLYVNHKPAVPLNSKVISSAFDLISTCMGGTVTWGDLKRLLISEGEVLSQNELDAYMLALLGNNGSVSENAVIDATSFAADILGFESAIA